MAKRRGGKQNKASAKGCAVLIAIVIAIGAVFSPKTNTSTQPSRSSNTVATATERGAKPEPSATITDTPSPAAQSAETNPTATKLAVVAEPQVQSMPPTSYTLRSTANVRSCPDTNCEALGRLESGQTITVDGGVRGGTFQGSNGWVRTNYNGSVGYVHQSLVIESALVAQPQQVQSQVQPPPVSQPVARTWDCNGDLYRCDSFASRAEMDAYWLACPGDPSNLDGNDDGEYCED